MLRSLTYCGLWAGLLLSTIQPTWGDDLFSQVKADSVLSPAAGTTPGLKVEDAQGKKLLNQAQLMDTLRDAGMEPLVDGERGASVKLQHSRWTFSFVIELPDDHEQLVLTLLLSQIDPKQQPTAERLLTLLTANRVRKPAFFSYNTNRRCLELISQVANEKVTPRNLRDELRLLATIADSTAASWEGTTAAATAPAAKPATTVAPPATPATTPPATTATMSLVGRWSATRSATEALAGRSEPRCRRSKRSSMPFALASS